MSFTSNIIFGYFITNKLFILTFLFYSALRALYVFALLAHIEWLPEQQHGQGAEHQKYNRGKYQSMQSHIIHPINNEGHNDPAALAYSLHYCIYGGSHLYMN